MQAQESCITDIQPLVGADGEPAAQGPTECFIIARQRQKASEHSALELEYKNIIYNHEPIPSGPLAEQIGLSQAVIAPRGHLFSFYPSAYLLLQEHHT